MSKISIEGNALGSGTFTIASPNSNTSRTLTLPDNTGTIVTQNSTPAFASTIGVGGATPSTSGAGITFPAAQSASSNANTLDDYEEGTWTPTVAGGTTAGTYTLSSVFAYYTKIGNQVTVWTSFGFSAASGGTGFIRIGGLPFSYRANAASFGAVSALNLNTSAASSNGMVIGAAASGSSTDLFPYLNIDNAGIEVIQIGAVSASTTFGFTFTYQVS